MRPTAARPAAQAAKQAEVKPSFPTRSTGEAGQRKPGAKQTEAQGRAVPEISKNGREVSSITKDTQHKRAR